MLSELFYLNFLKKKNIYINDNLRTSAFIRNLVEKSSWENHNNLYENSKYFRSHGNDILPIIFVKTTSVIHTKKIRAVLLLKNIILVEL